MSHFTVLVISADHEAALQPFHEFECTGTDDQYVQNIDRTQEARDEFASRKEGHLRRLTDGTLHDYFDENGEWKPEFSKPDTSSAFSNRRVRHVPEGYEAVEVPVAEVQTLADFATGWYGWEAVPFDQKPDLIGAHKYGYVLLNEAGEVAQCIDRTNPNKKWDWWSVGGRWPNKLLFKNGSRGSTGLAGDLDFDGMLAEQATTAGDLFDAVTAVIAGREVHSWASILARLEAGEFAIDEARDLYNNQQVVKDLIARKAIDDWDGSGQLSCVLAAKNRAQYVERESQINSSTWALLHNGNWTERGRMGWFATSDATEGTTLDYAANYWLTLRSLAADERVTVVDCHI